MRAIPERLRGAFTTRRYTNTRLPYLTLHTAHGWRSGVVVSALAEHLSSGASHNKALYK